jgi:hypothetical protein
MVEHGLKVTPNFILWMVEEDLSASPIAPSCVMGFGFVKTVKYNTSSSTTYTRNFGYRGYGSSGSLGGVTTQLDSSNYFTSTTAPIFCNSAYPAVAGYTYRWVCGVMEGIQ